MSDIDPTPETPVTIGDRLGWFRGDLAARLAALLGTPPADLAQLLAAVNLVRGVEPAGDLGLIAQRLAQLRGVNNATLSTLLSETQFDTTMLLLVGHIVDVKNLLTDTNNRLDNIQSVLGAEPYSSLETGNIRAILYSMLTSQGNIGITPDGKPPEVSSAITKTLNGRRYVVWTNPITGVSRSEELISLTPETSWNGYSIYVQSPAATFQSGAQSGAEFPTNSWLTTPLVGTIAISVESQYTVHAYMRTPVSGYVWRFDNGEISAVSTSLGTRWLPTTSKYSDLTWVTMNGNVRALSGSWSGWRWEIVGKSPQSVWGTNELTSISNSSTGTISTPANRWVVQYYDPPGAGAYIRIIQPNTA